MDLEEENILLPEFYDYLQIVLYNSLQILFMKKL